MMQMSTPYTCPHTQAGLLYDMTPGWELNMSYVEPCEQYIAPPLQLYTGTAAATIVGVSVFCVVGCVSVPLGGRGTDSHTPPFLPTPTSPPTPAAR